MGQAKSERRWTPGVAEALAETALRAAGLAGTDLHLISFRQNAVFRLPTAKYSLRIYGPNQDPVRAGAMVATARWLEGADFPAVRLAAIGAPQPIDVDGYAATFWRWIDETPASVDRHAAFGRLLRRFHDLPNPADVEAPQFDPSEKVRNRIAILRERSLLDVRARTQLSDMLARIENELAISSAKALDPGLIHGDATPGNVLPTAAGLALIDLDSVSYGAREWDLAPMAAMAERFWRDPGRFDRFLEGYGVDADLLPRIRLASQMKQLTMTAYLCLSAGQSPEIDAEIRRRLASWANDDATTRWTSGFRVDRTQ